MPSKEPASEIQHQVGLEPSTMRDAIAVDDQVLAMPLDVDLILSNVLHIEQQELPFPATRLQGLEEHGGDTQASCHCSNGVYHGKRR